MKHLTLSIAIIQTVFLCLFLAPKAFATETMFFDSTDRYLGACQLTDKSEWELKEEAVVSKFEVWYSWNQAETELPVKIYKDGKLFAEFTATRAGCDPYQHQWCNADYQINKTFPAGKYSTEIPNRRQCLKPGGTGAIRLYKEDGTVTPTPTPTISETPTPTKEIITATSQPTATPIQVINNTCSCNKNVIVTSIASSSAVSLLLWLLLKKR